MTVQKFPDFCLISFDRTPEFQNSIKQFLLGSDTGHIMSVHPSDYESFLKVVHSFNKDIVVAESIYFDSQEPISDFMLTNHIIKNKITDLVFEDDKENKKQKKEQTSIQDRPDIFSDKTNNNSIMLEKIGQEFKLTFYYNAQLVDIIKTIENRRYVPETRNWFIPCDQKNLFLQKIRSLNYSVVIR